MVALYDLWPGNGESLLWFQRFIKYSLNYLLRHLQPGPHTGPQVKYINEMKENFNKSHCALKSIMSLVSISDGPSAFSLSLLLWLLSKVNVTSITSKVHLHSRAESDSELTSFDDGLRGDGRTDI